MTDDEQNTIIAEMVREGRDLRVRIGCIEEKLRRAGDGFRAAAEAVRSSKDGGSIYFPDTAFYPDIAEFRRLLRSLKESNTRLKEIQSFIAVK